MKRRWNLSIWAGFLLVLTAAGTYLPVFVPIPSTRDFPWPTLLLFGAGLFLIARGLRCAFGEPALYRGKIAGSILGTLSVAIVGLFCYGVFYSARELPASTKAPHVGQKAPDFALLDERGAEVRLSSLLAPGAGGATAVNGVLLIFYRGYW